MADTGNTATVTFSSTGLSLTIESINLGEETLEAIADDDLTTTNYLTYFPGDLAEPGEVVISYQFDQSATAFVPAKRGTVQTFTCTMPLKTNENTAGTFVATGFVNRHQRPTLQNNQKMISELTFKLDGKTEPAFTAGSTT